MLLENMNYPYNIVPNINETYYIDYESGVYGDTVEIIELSNEQKNIMLPFFNMLNLISDPQYFIDLKNQPDVIAFSIDTIYLVKYASDQIYIHAGIRFYTNKNPGGHTIFNKEYDFWEYNNIAIYSIKDYRFLGFHF